MRSSYFHKPHRHYNYRFHEGPVESLYRECKPWPASRSTKRDAMIEEIQRLSSQSLLARAPNHCVYELWADGRIQPCNILVWTHEDLCPEHKPFVESLSQEYRWAPKAKPISYAALARSWYATYGHVGKPKRVRIGVQR